MSDTYETRGRVTLFPAGRLPWRRGNGQPVIAWAGLETDVAIVGAPLAGGPSTPALAAAVSEAGGVGFLAAGYKTAAAVQAELHELRAMTARPIGLNIFFPTRDSIDEAALQTYTDRMRGEAQRYGVAVGAPRWTDDDWTAKLELAARERPDVVSFTFGCPERDTVESLRGLRFLRLLGRGQTPSSCTTTRMPVKCAREN